MALSFQSLQSKKRSQVIAIDLGQRNSKAVYVQRHGSGFEMLQYVVQESPIHEKNSSAAVVADHLKNISQALNAKTKSVVLMIGVNDALLRLIEVPMLPVSDLRLMLKYNSKNYLQQDLADYVFDCFILPPRVGGNTPEPAKNQKCRALVGGAKKQLLDKLQDGAREAGLVTDQITLDSIGTANAFELAQPEIFSKEIVALVDIGFKHSTINILLNGELTLSRVVGIGGDKLTSGLAEALGVSYSEAEQRKLAQTEETQPLLSALLMPLGRELRASIDFFEKQEDKTVGQVFFSGSSARSTFLVESLQSELMVQCQRWNPTSFFKLALPPAQMGEIEQTAPLLAVASGGAVAAF